MSVHVELIYDLDCPNVQDARRALLQSFADLNITPTWTEWDRESSESPPYARLYGSPTILVNGRDITGAGPVEEANCCRVYLHGSRRLRGVTPVLSIVAALRHKIPSTSEASAKRPTGWWRSLTALPGLGAAFLPVGGCPACWPVYSAVLGALGLAFLLDSAHALWITFMLLCMALVALAFRAKARRGFGPFILGAVSSGMILFFKFAWMSDSFVYVGLSGLVIASFWNAWAKKAEKTGACPRCTETVR